MNIKDDWKVRLGYKRASSRFENGNCDHKKDSFFLENTMDLIDLTFEETIGRFNGFQETIEHLNGFEVTIGNFQWFLRRPSPLNVFCSLTIAINGFSMVFGLGTIAFNGFRWFWTIGQTMRWFRWIAMVYCAI